MTKEELAAQLTGHERRHEISSALAAQATQAGLVVVFGGSDDLMEMRGAWTEKFDAWKGTELLLTPAGVWDAEACSDKCFHFRAAHQKARRQGHLLEAVWDAEGYAWIYNTTLAHATFDIMEEDEKYCRGIVFALTDLK